MKVPSTTSWGGDSNNPLTMTSSKLAKLVKKFRIPGIVELTILEAHERTYYPKLDCVAVSK